MPERLLRKIPNREAQKHNESSADDMYPIESNQWPIWLSQSDTSLDLNFLAFFPHVIGLFIAKALFTAWKLRWSSAPVQSKSSPKTYSSVSFFLLFKLLLLSMTLDVVQM